jgi:hypothetical protein
MKKLLLRFLHRYGWGHPMRLVSVEDYMTAFDFRFECSCGAIYMQTDRPQTVEGLLSRRQFAFEFNRSKPAHLKDPRHAD